MRNKMILLLIFILFLSVEVFSETGFRTYNLFESSGVVYHEEQNTRLSFYEHYSTVKRFREAVISKEIIDFDALEQGDQIILNLFDDREYRGTIDLLSYNVMGTKGIRARIHGHNLGYIIVSTHEERSLSHIYIPEKREYYKIISDALKNTHFLMEIDLDEYDYIESSPVIIPPPLTEEQRGEQQRIRDYLDRQEAIRPDVPATVDVMIVYTPAAANWANSNGGIANVINSAIHSGQTALDNSGTLMSINLVYAGLVDYVESGTSVVDLVRLTTTATWTPFDDDYYNGHYVWDFMNDVHDWRDTYGADLVALLAHVSDVGGVGWLLNDQNGRPHLGFSLTRVQQAAGTSYTFVHELGHNMGLHHHAQQTTQPGPTNWFNWPENTWSAGWRWTGTNNSRYCSVMTYASGDFFPDGQDHLRVPHFSNPDIIHQGVPTGHAVQGDNARTLREIRHVIAAYRYILEVPEVVVEIVGNNVNISWEAVELANSYKVYSTDDISQEDWGAPVSIVSGTSYSEPLTGRRFYRVVASADELP